LLNKYLNIYLLFILMNKLLLSILIVFFCLNTILAIDSPIVVIKIPDVPAYQEINENNTYFNYTINGTEVVHNQMTGLQGGSANEYFHLNQSIFDYLLANIFTWGSVGNASTFVGITTLSYNGNQAGYTGMNALCNGDYVGSHVCSWNEVKKSINNGITLTAGQFWVSTGFPGYTANANDCLGWTSASSTYLAPFWDTTATVDVGAGYLSNCANTHQVGCCR
jgi:hypothetical protein